MQCNAAVNACCLVNACMSVSVVCGGVCIMRVIVYDETKDARCKMVLRTNGSRSSR